MQYRPQATGEERTGRCAGCGGEFPVRVMAEVVEGSLEFIGVPLMYFVGDRLCRECHGRAC